MDTKIETEKLLLRYHEAAEILGLGLNTVSSLVKDGRLPVVRIAKKCVRIPLDGLRRFIESETQSSVSGAKHHV